MQGIYDTHCFHPIKEKQYKYQIYREFQVIPIRPPAPVPLAVPLDPLMAKLLLLLAGMAALAIDRSSSRSKSLCSSLGELSKRSPLKIGFRMW